MIKTKDQILRWQLLLEIGTTSSLMIIFTWSVFSRQVSECKWFKSTFQFWRLREKQVIVAVEGKYRNVVYIIPPLCFSKHNANTFIEALDDVVNDLVKEEILDKVNHRQHKLSGILIGHITYMHGSTHSISICKLLLFLAFVETRARVFAGK